MPHLSQTGSSVTEESHSRLQRAREVDDDEDPKPFCCNKCSEMFLRLPQDTRVLCRKCGKDTEPEVKRPATSKSKLGLNREHDITDVGALHRINDERIKWLLKKQDEAREKGDTATVKWLASELEVARGGKPFDDGKDIKGKGGKKKDEK